MDLRRLNYFLTLAEELHFGKAAERLRIAQPPLSRQIRNLEEELNVRLFNRTKRSVQLTDHGDYLKKEAVKLFHHVELIKNHIQLLSEGRVGQIRIAYVGSAMHSVLPEVLREISQRLPDVHMSMVELMSLDQLAAFKTGNLDIGFVRTPITVDDLCVEPIFSETLSVVLPLSHPLAGAKVVRPVHLAKEPFIGFCRECAPGLFGCITSLCNREGFAPRIVHESSQINSVVRFVESGLGYSIVPTSVKRAYNVKVRFYELDEYPERAELALAYHPDHQTRISKQVIEIVQASKFGSVQNA
jgi:DNA-binding transcriptional LysR family regulator